MNLISDLTNQLLAVGIPIKGVNNFDATLRTATPDFAPDVTKDQMNQAEQIIAQFQWVEKVPKTIDELSKDIIALSPDDQTRLLNLALADFLTRNETIALSFGISLQK